jgi:hypothetical protein
VESPGWIQERADQPWARASGEANEKISTVVHREKLNKTASAQGKSRRERASQARAHDEVQGAYLLGNLLPAEVLP